MNDQAGFIRLTGVNDSARPYMMVKASEIVRVRPLNDHDYFTDYSTKPNAYVYIRDYSEPVVETVEQILAMIRGG